LSGLSLPLSATPASRQLTVLSKACASCSLRAVIASTRPSTLPLRPPKACSLVSYPCAITGMHACSCDNAHACIHSDGPAYSSLPGANPPWLSGLCLAATPVGGPLSTQGSERFFELLTPFCRRVDTLVGRLSLCLPMPAAWPLSQPATVSGMWVRTCNRQLSC
jgi:hypothetical protein